MKLTKSRVNRPVSMTLCLLSTALFVACGGGGGSEESGPTETADANSKNQSSQGVIVSPNQQVTAPAPAPAPATTAPAPAPAPAPVPPSFSLELSWVAPQANADGTALTDLAGYRILVGTASGSYSRIITVDSPSTVNYTIPNLPAATYYVVVKAVDAANNESAPSSELVKVLR